MKTKLVLKSLHLGQSKSKMTKGLVIYELAQCDGSRGGMTAAAGYGYRILIHATMSGPILLQDVPRVHVKENMKLN